MDAMKRPQLLTPAFRMLLGTVLAGASLAHAQTQPAFEEVSPFVDDLGSGGLLQLHAQVPGQSMVTLQYKPDLDSPDWSDFSPPTLVLNPKMMSFTVPSTPDAGVPPSAYFRLRVDPADVSVKDDGEILTVNSDKPVPAGLLLDVLGQQTGADFFPTGGVDPFAPIGPLQLSAANAEDLLSQAGLRVWGTPIPKDDPKNAGRFLGNTNLQVKPLPPDPNDVGRGKIEDGFDGIAGLPTPPDGPADPPVPDPKADRPFNPDIKPADDFVPQREDPTQTEPGHHVRMGVLLDLKGGVKLEFAMDRPGDALLIDPETGGVAWPENPPLNALIYVIRSPIAANNPDNIYYIGMMPDPFQARAYDPPFRGAHGGPILPDAHVRLPLPVLDRDTQLKGLELQFLRLAKPLSADMLTPDVLLRSTDSFESLGVLSGDEIWRQVIAGQGVQLPQGLPAPTLTTLHVSGSRASKFNMVIIGDGFANTAADQNQFNDYVTTTIMQDLVTRDVHPEILNAINLYRINTFSQQSGVTQVDGNGNVTVNRNTALQWRYSGNWNRCWMEYGPNTVALMNGVVNSLVPEADIIAVVLNQAGQGGCSRSAAFAVTRTRPWSTFAHEFGHFFGKLGDEYQCNQGTAGCGCYGGTEPSAANLTAKSSRNQIPWNIWIPSWRPVPTGLGNIVDTDQDSGLFPGATIGSGQWWNCIYRPSWRGRMNNNTPLHNPLGYTRMREEARKRQDADLRKNVVGDFNGDGFTDAVILDGRQLSLYLADDRDPGPDDPITGNPPRHVTGVLKPTWYFTDRLTNSTGSRSWQIRGSDMLFPGDFNGDGKDDLYVVNLTAWNIPYLTMLQSTGTGFVPVARYDRQLPGWDDMRGHDEFYVGDFTGDGKDDLMVFNGQDWNMPYFILLRSTGGSLAYSHRYDRYLPGWEMGRHEKFFVGNFNGDEMKEVCSLNRDDWNQVHLMVFRSTGAALALSDRYYGTIQFPFWTMRRQDQLYVLDFNKDGRSDIAIFNGRNWTPEYLCLLAGDAKGGLQRKRRYDDTIPGWDMNRRDRFYVADVDGDQDDDLVVYNGDNWAVEYLGMLRSDGVDRLSGSWQDDWIGGWNLGPGDDFHVADFRGAAHWDDLFVFNQGWFGLLRSQSNRFQLETIYRKWIHNHRYHGYGWW